MFYVHVDLDDGLQIVAAGPLLAYDAYAWWKAPAAPRLRKATVASGFLLGLAVLNASVELGRDAAVFVVLGGIVLLLFLRTAASFVQLAGDPGTRPRRRATALFLALAVCGEVIGAASDDWGVLAVITTLVAAGYLLPAVLVVDGRGPRPRLGSKLLSGALASAAGLIGAAGTLGGFLLLSRFAEDLVGETAGGVVSVLALMGLAWFAEWSWGVAWALRLKHA